MVARLVPWLALAAVSVAFYGLPLLVSALPLAAQSDVGFATQLTRSVADSFSSGVLYPRWVDRINAGFGAPVFLYYSPMSYWLSGAAALLVGGPIRGLALGAVAVAFLSGASFFLALRRFSGLAATVGALIYVALPYHVLDLYVRFAWAEFCAFVWFPPIFVLCAQLHRRVSLGRFLLLSFCFAGLVLTHALSAVLLALVLLPYSCVLLWWNRRLGGIVAGLAAAVFALTLSGAYVVPLALRGGEVQLQRFTEGQQLDWRRSFVFSDETAQGYAASATKPLVTRAVLAQQLPAVAAGALLLAYLISGRRKPSAVRSIQDSDVHVALLVCSVWTVVLQTPLSTPLWALLPGMAALQFPWRFAMLQGLVTCLLVSAALGQSDPDPRRRRAVLGLVGVATLPLVLASALSIVDARLEFDATAAANPPWSAVLIPEYLPASVPVGRVRRRWVGSVETAPVKIEPTASFQVERWTDQRRIVLIDAETTSTLRLRTFDFAGWTATLDGSDVAIRPDGPLNAVSIKVPAGQRRAEFRFVGGAGQRTGVALSSVGLAVFGALTVVALRRRRQST